ncbi:hypothetical protein LAY57_23560 [Argonema antarcticum A004/B2]|nr:hypothetical protein [Argonema antarcticum A004/B2]
MPHSPHLSTYSAIRGDPIADIATVTSVRTVLNAQSKAETVFVLKPKH